MEQLPGLGQSMLDRGRETQERHPKRKQVDVHLHLPVKGALGCPENIQDELRSISMSRAPRIAPARFLDEPRLCNSQGTFLWTRELNASKPLEPQPESETFSHVDEAFDEKEPVLPTESGLALELAPTCSWMRPGDVFAKQPTTHHLFDLPLKVHGCTSKDADSFAKDVELQLAVPRQLRCSRY